MPFKVILIEMGQPITLTTRFNYSDTVLKIKEEYFNNENNSKPVSKIDLYHNGTQLLNNKTIEYYDDDIDKDFRCVLSFKCGGGSAESKEEKQSSKNKSYKIGFKIENRKRIFSNEIKKKIKTSKKSCVIYGDCPTLNMIMSCGDVLCPDAIFNQIHNTLSKNKNTTKILCPNCNKEWSFKEYSRGACLFDDEYDVISLEIQKRLAPESKKCPNCNSPNSKPDDLRMSRVACQCGKGDWCWFCAKKWVGGGFTVCGNNDCVSNDINITLAKCAEKSLGASYGNVIVPIFRACPKCYQV